MLEQLPPISESLWWAIPNRLAGVRKPTTDLIALKELKVHALVSLLSDDTNLKLYEQHAIPHLWLPIEGGTPPSLEQLKQLTAFVDAQNTLGHAVAVHCSNGLRRTGTVLAAFLIQKGADYESAIADIVAANSAVTLREAQTSFLKSLSA